MTKKEIVNKIEKLTEELEDLKKAFELAEKLEQATPDCFRGEELRSNCFYSVDADGNIQAEYHDVSTLAESWSNRRHRIYPSKDIVMELDKKFQFIADLMWFKYNHDREYTPDWSNCREKYFVFFDHKTKKYGWNCIYYCCEETTIYFSSKDIVCKCVEWLNSRKDGV